MQRGSKQRIEENLAYGEAMVACYDHMLTPHERTALHTWEDSPQFTSTDDWPGWEKYIGKRPGAVEAVARRRA